jgi:hypothetical protein
MLDFTKENNWNFETIKEPVLRPNGQQVPNLFNLVRTDTDTVLHTHRDSYTVLSHDNVVNATHESIKAANISNDFDFKVDCIDSGRKLQIDVLFNDVVTEPAVGDYVKFRIRAFNSYDGSWAFQTSADAERLWCLNGCTTADSISKLWMRHTSQISTEGAAAKIVNGLEIFHTQKDLWQHWMKQKVDHNSAEQFFKRTLVNHKTKSSEENWNKKQLENLMGQLDSEFANLGKNQWAVYNCMTHWATHTQGAKSPHNVTRDREQKVAFALNTPTWKNGSLA